MIYEKSYDCDGTAKITRAVLIRGVKGVVDGLVY